MEKPIDYLDKFVEALKTEINNGILDEFIKTLKVDLERGNRKWGDTWRNRPRKGQEQRVKQYIMDMFDRNEFAGTPIRWESLAGEALIAWIRDNHPELFSE